MSKTTRHAAEKYAANNRHYPGEDKAIPLLKWLNEPGNERASNHSANEEAKKQIRGLLDRIIDLGATEDVERSRKLAAEINEMLSECAIVPLVEIVVNPRPSVPPVCAFDYWPAPGTRHYEDMYGNRIIGRERSWPAHHYFMLLFDIWRSGNMARFRRCEACEDFLYKRFKTQRTCGGRCQETAYQRSPEYKVKRNERLRLNYQIQKRSTIRRPVAQKEKKMIELAGI